MRALFGVVVCAVSLLSLCTNHAEAAGKKSTKDWSKVDIGQLEKDWQDGDDEWLLQSEYEYQKKVGEMKVKKANPDLDFNDRQAFMRAGGLAAVNSNGPQMMFIDLKHRPDNMEPWDRASVDELAARWKQLSQTGGLSINLYNMGLMKSDREPEGKPRYKLIAALDKGWQANDVVNFLRERPETAWVTWNSNTYWSTYPGEWDGEL